MWCVLVCVVQWTDKSTTNSRYIDCERRQKLPQAGIRTNIRGRMPLPNCLHYQIWINLFIVTFLNDSFLRTILHFLRNKFQFLLLFPIVFVTCSFWEARLWIRPKASIQSKMPSDDCSFRNKSKRLSRARMWRRKRSKSPSVLMGSPFRYAILTQSHILIEKWHRIIEWKHLAMITGAKRDEHSASISIAQHFLLCRWEGCEEVLQVSASGYT